MIVVALLAALACLVVGLILTSSTWLIVSLVATALAAGLVVETRFRLSRAQRRAARSTPQPAAARRATSWSTSSTLDRVITDPTAKS